MRLYIKYFSPDGTETIESIDPEYNEVSYANDISYQQTVFLHKLKTYVEKNVSQNTRGYDLFYDNMQVNVDRVTMLSLCNTLLKAEYYGLGQKDILNVIAHGVKIKEEPFENWDSV